MEPKLKHFLINTCLWVFGLAIIFSIIIFAILYIEKVQQPFKETLTISVSFLSAVATLGAAIIAARLFQTWKTQHSYVEQIKILSQMLEKVSEIQKNLGAARKNANLAGIILSENPTPTLDTIFLEQADKIKVLQDSLNSLSRLENQIHLLNNDKRNKPIFYDTAGEVCPLEALLDFNKELEIGIWEIHNSLNDDLEGGNSGYKHFDLKDKRTQWLLLNAMSDGAWYIYQKAPLNPDLLNINTMLEDWLRGLDQRIMNYRDSLDKLN